MPRFQFVLSNQTVFFNTPYSGTNLLSFGQNDFKCLAKFNFTKTVRLLLSHNQHIVLAAESDELVNVEVGVQSMVHSRWDVSDSGSDGSLNSSSMHAMHGPKNL